MDSGVRVIYKFDAGVAGAALAREIVDEELSDYVDQDTLDELQLLVAEMVTHRVRLADDDETITLDLRAEGDVSCGVRLESAAPIWVQAVGQR
jgi:hypothetical protein